MHCAHIAQEQKKGQEKLEEMGRTVNRIVIRRTNSILSKYLPPKVEQVVCCRLTKMQADMYKKMLKSSDVLDALHSGEDGKSSLSSINKLKKICNHPILVYQNAKVRVAAPAACSHTRSIASLALRA